MKVCSLSEVNVDMKLPEHNLKLPYISWYLLQSYKMHVNNIIFERNGYPDAKSEKSTSLQDYS